MAAQPVQFIILQVFNALRALNMKFHLENRNMATMVFSSAQGFIQKTKMYNIKDRNVCIFVCQTVL